MRFEKLQAVDGVSFSLQAGSLLGLIGPNGAGKTTLLRALAGLQGFDRGAVRVLGEPVEQQLSHVGFTPDVPPAYERLTVRQFLTFIGLGYELSAADTRERIDFWLEKVWLTEKADQKVGKLSRGMRQRLGLARTLLANPSVVLLDEPAAGLDPAGRVQFRELLVNLREQGKALIVSSHILSDMNEYCTHIGIMSAGRLMQFGTVRQIAEQHETERCRYQVVLARPVNGMDRELEGIDGLSVVVSDTSRPVLEFGADAASAAMLLRELIRRELPVASFTAIKIDLEQAYLRTGIRQVD